ncbi:membrane protein insertion efficiency factor YidD [Flavobacterium columnare]|uniref:membrane protein insertion efficiency factor YidD n=1 Tax=Flavobacterium columnare TaxID=996 RepID=UPI0040342A3B
MSIRLYWLTKPKNKKPRCIFRKSCSHFIYEETLQNGFLKGLKAFHYRFKNCRSGFEVFKNPISNQVQMLLTSNQIIEEEEIAKRLITHLK